MLATEPDSVVFVAAYTDRRPRSQPVNNAIRIGAKPDEVTGTDDRIGNGLRLEGCKIGVNVRDQ